MIAALRNRFDALADRERRVVILGAVAALVLLLLAVLLPMQRAVTQAAARVERKQSDLAWMQQMAPSFASAPQAPPPNQESLIVLVDRSAREGGLGQALTGSQPAGSGGLRAQFEKASFNQLVAWIATLAQQYGVQAEIASFEAVADSPGVVNAAVTLRAP